MKLNEWLISLLVIASATWVKATEPNKGYIMPNDATQEEYCAGCLATAKVFEKPLKEFAANKKKPLQDLPDLDDYCKLKYFNQSKVMNQKICDHILDHYVEDIEDFHKLDTRLTFDKWLCYELTFSCMGIKLKQNEPKGEEEDLTDEYIENLLHENEEKVVYAKPSRPEDEL